MGLRLPYEEKRMSIREEDVRIRQGHAVTVTLDEELDELNEELGQTIDVDQGERQRWEGFEQITKA